MKHEYFKQVLLFFLFVQCDTIQVPSRKASAAMLPNRSTLTKAVFDPQVVPMRYTFGQRRFALLGCIFCVLFSLGTIVLIGTTFQMEQDNRFYIGCEAKTDAWGTVTNPCFRFASSSNADNVTAALLAVLCAITSMIFALYVVNAKPLPEYIYDERRGSILCLVQVIQVTIAVTGGAALIYGFVAHITHWVHLNSFVPITPLGYYILVGFLLCSGLFVAAFCYGLYKFVTCCCTSGCCSASSISSDFCCHLEQCCLLVCNRKLNQNCGKCNKALYQSDSISVFPTCSHVFHIECLPSGEKCTQCEAISNNIV